MTGSFVDNNKPLRKTPYSKLVMSVRFCSKRLFLREESFDGVCEVISTIMIYDCLWIYKNLLDSSKLK
jgi:hypothetical protein